MLPAPRRSFTALVAGLSIVASLAMVATARAQLAQVCLALNESSPGNEYLTVTDKTGLEGNAAYTIEAWVKPVSYSGFPTIVGNDFTMSYWLGLTSSGNVRFYPRGGSSVFVDAPSTVPLDRWTHVAAVYNSATGYAIYINGQLDASGASITGPVGSNPGDLRIGADRQSGSPSYFWRGYLDEIRIWSVARTGPQILETMTTALGTYSHYPASSYAGIRANWVVEGALATFMSEYGASPNNRATFVNGDLFSHVAATGPPVSPNLALELNGVDDYAVLPVTEDFSRGVTVMAWIAPTDQSNFPTIAGRDFLSSFWLGLTPAHRLRFYPGCGGSVDGLTPISNNHWIHVAASYADGRTVLYVNGRVDLISTALTGPVGANGRDVWIGADNGASGLAYPFPGWLDQVKVVQAALTLPQVREQMYRGYPSYINPLNILQVDGMTAPMYHAEFCTLEFLDVHGSGAKIVRGGTPAMSLSMSAAAYPLQNFAVQLDGSTDLPDADIETEVFRQVEWPLAGSVTDVEVLLSAPITNLESTTITLESPEATTIELLHAGDAVGRDLLTVFNDDLGANWNTGEAPFHDGVRPSEPLSTFNGEDPQGFWTLRMSTTLPDHVDLWAWGLRINGAVLDVDPSPTPGAALRLAGPNPVRAAGGLAFDLARPAHVDLSLFDVGGRRVLPILAGARAAGAYRMQFQTRSLATGVYFARLVVDGAEAGQLKVEVVR